MGAKMHAEAQTKLPLYDFARIIGINPLHFAGIDLELAGHACNSPWPQYEWQHGDRVGRDAVARAIAMAEENIEAQLGYRLMPAYEVGERLNAFQFWQPEFRAYFPSRAFQTRWPFIVSPGVRALTLLGADRPITWGQAGYWQRGTVTATVPAGTDPCEIRIYYPGKDGDPTWEIRPSEVEISGTTATITFPRECAVIEDKWQALEFEAADGEDDLDFLTAVDVYREYPDPSLAVTYLWEPTGLCDCGGEDCENCTLQEQVGCFYVRDDRNGWVITKPGSWEDGVFTQGEFDHGRYPDGVLLSYLAGHRDQRMSSPRCDLKVMEPGLARMVAYYAASLLERPPCDCVVDSWEYWRKEVDDGQRVARISRTRPTPLGSREGAHYAWQRVRNLRLGEGAVLAR